MNGRREDGGVARRSNGEAEAGGGRGWPVERRREGAASLEQLPEMMLQGPLPP